MQGKEVPPRVPRRSIVTLPVFVLGNSGRCQAVFALTSFTVPYYQVREQDVHPAATTIELLIPPL